MTIAISRDRFRAEVTRKHARARGRARVVVTGGQGIYATDAALFVFEPGAVIGPRDAQALGLRLVWASRRERADLKRAGYRVA